MTENLLFSDADIARAHRAEWGPAHLRSDTLTLPRIALDLRDGAGDLPEDN